MEPFILSFLLKSLVITAFIPVILTFNALSGKAFPAQLRYAVWLVVLAGLIIPLPPATGGGIVTIRYTAAASPDEAMPFQPAPVAAYAGADAGPSFFAICALAWGIIALAVFAWHIRRYIRFLRAIRRWGVTVQDEDTLSAFRAVQEEMGLGGKKIGLKICGFVSSSMLTGFMRPVILLPQKHFEADELELIFRHELIHYKRRDLPVKLLSVIALSLYWFNPLVYWMCRAMQAEGETSCDEAVLRDSGAENRRFYAEVIIGMIGGRDRASTMLSTCFFYRGKFSIKKRLDAIMDTTRKMRWPAALVLAAVMAATLFSGSVFAFTAREFSAFDAPPYFAPELPVTVGGSMHIALAVAGGGTVEEIELDHDGGATVYEVTVRNGRWKYEIKIDAATGEIFGFERDLSILPQIRHPARISFEQAIETALARAGGGEVEEIELEREWGLLVYEVKVRHNGREYEIKVNADTGAVVF